MINLTILMPCLNEEENIAFCVDQALLYLQSQHLTGEILVVDNDSTDDSAAIAVSHEARVITEHRRGYGRALRTGLEKARGDVIIFGDCDSTYDFSNLDPIYTPLATGEADFVTGDRFGGLMEQGAMSWSHRLGVPFLSICGRLKFGIKIHDWHCGIRGITRTALEKLDLRCDAMEFATEMIAEVARHRLTFKEVSVQLKKAQHNRTEKLRTIRDGFRHLWYILRA